MPRARSVAELPNEEVKGHQGFTARPLMDLTDKGVTIRMLGISPAGIGPVPAHRHADKHLFLVLEGKLSLTIDDETHLVSKGEFIEVPEHSVHQLKNDQDREISVLALKWS
jgi:quercetin dioxygenase-like cupin family protein